ncbi:hypothetical protein GGR52DRAFT_544827 [Hypoxylon sp. FL1284]|nr:hypothetical protein GGR52DRAFT_544827 [Hypoxylon sp. FL1284]
MSSSICGTVRSGIVTIVLILRVYFHYTFYYQTLDHILTNEASLSKYLIYISSTMALLVSDYVYLKYEIEVSTVRQQAYIREFDMDSNDVTRTYSFTRAHMPG